MRHSLCRTDLGSASTGLTMTINRRSTRTPHRPLHAHDAAEHEDQLGPSFVLAVNDGTSSSSTPVNNRVTAEAVVDRESAECLPLPLASSRRGTKSEAAGLDEHALLAASVTHALVPGGVRGLFRYSS